MVKSALSAKEEKDYKVILNKILDDKYQARLNRQIEQSQTVLYSIELESLFQALNRSCSRLQALYSEIDVSRQMQGLLDLGLQTFSALFSFLMGQMEGLVPDMSRKVSISPTFYEVVNQVNTLLQRLDILYQKYYIFDSNSYQHL